MNFFNSIHYLCLDKQDLIEDKTILEDLSNFQVLMKVLWQSDWQDRRETFKTTLSLLFPNYNVGLTPNSIIFLGNESREVISTIDTNNFEILQNIIKDICCVNSLFNKDEVVYNPAGKKAQEIAEKIYKGRQKKKKLQEKQNHKQKSIFTNYISILTVGLSSMSLQDCLNLTVYQIFDLINRYSLYLTWDIDQKIRLAGGKPDSEAENWMKDIHI